MYELIQVTDHCYYIECPARIGLVRLEGNEVCLIDSGSDKDAGKKALRHIQQNGWTLTAVYNTHSHADHIGGSKYLQAQTGCKVYAPGIECDFTRHPVLEPSLLYGGYPCKELRNKFLMAQECDAEPLTEDALPEGMSIIPLPGHSFDMVGFRTADGVVYLADCLSSEATLEKYQIGFVYDVGAYIHTLEAVRGMEAACFVPAHAAATKEIAPLAQANIDKVHEIVEKIAQLCEAPICFEQILKRLFDAYGLTLNAQQYVLVGSTVRSYLSYMKEAGLLTYVFEENQMLWKRCQGE